MLYICLTFWEFDCRIEAFIYKIINLRNFFLNIVLNFCWLFLLKIDNHNYFNSFYYLPTKDKHCNSRKKEVLDSINDKSWNNIFQVRQRNFKHFIFIFYYFIYLYIYLLWTSKKKYKRVIEFRIKLNPKKNIQFYQKRRSSPNEWKRLNGFIKRKKKYFDT